MYKLAVIGNCQVQGIAQALRYLVKDSVVTCILNWETNDKYCSDEMFIEELSSYHHIFIQTSFSGRVTKEFLDVLERKCKSIVKFPPFMFTAFHPDLIYFSNPNGGLLGSPIGDYHSAIALFG